MVLACQAAEVDLCLAAQLPTGVGRGSIGGSCGGAGFSGRSGDGITGAGSTGRRKTVTGSGYRFLLACFRLGLAGGDGRGLATACPGLGLHFLPVGVWTFFPFRPRFLDTAAC